MERGINQLGTIQRWINASITTSNIFFCINSKGPIGLFPSSIGHTVHDHINESGMALLEGGQPKASDLFQKQ